MRQYLEALEYILENGSDRMDRTGVGTRAVFGLQLRFKMSRGFPAITTKQLAFKSMLAELLWFLAGSRDVRQLQRLNCHIWDANYKADYWKPHAEFPGDVGRIYGVQWRDWRTQGRSIDQLADAIEQLKKKPYNRRIIVTAWNPGELDYYEEGKVSAPRTALSPCHILYQFFVAKGRLSLQMYQRSADFFLGVPFNIASYSLLLHIIAAITDLEPYESIFVFGDSHIYKNHFKQVKEQLSRKPYSLPKLKLSPVFSKMKDIKDLDKFLKETFERADKIWEKEKPEVAKKKVYELLDEIATLKNYKCHPPIKAPMAV